MAENKVAIYPGKFDPITNGHIDIIKRSLKVFDRIIIAVHENHEALFSADERIEMIKNSTEGMDVEVDKFSGLLVDYSKKKGVKLIVRGLRAVSDFEYEFQMEVMNRKLYPEIDVVFFMTDKEYFYLRARTVKEIAKLGGSINGLVPDFVEQKLKDKFK